MTANDVAGLAKIFGVDFAHDDVNVLQNWMDEEESEKNSIEVIKNRISR